MPPVTLRRNGKVPSCEPCRKSKLSCDHESPICGRCRRRKITDRCVYHPAPMTNGRALATSSPPSKNETWSTVDVSESIGSPTVSSSTPRDTEAGRLSTDVYLGSTSFSAVFTEGQNHPQLQNLPEVDEEDMSAACQAKIKLGLTPAKIQEGAEVLALLSDLHKYEPGFSRWHKVHCMAALLPFVNECIQLVTQSIGHSPRSRASLLKLSEKVFISTSKDLVIHSTTNMQDLPLILMGDSLRWDMAGLMLTAGGLSAISMDEVSIDPEDNLEQVNWKDVAKQLLLAGDKCIAFCEHVDSLNDVGVWLIMMNLILHTQVEGDADQLCWRKQGGLNTAIFALGLHQESKESLRTPFFLEEIRRKTFWWAFLMDKNIATFLGRPPMINSNFCSRRIPLDLEDMHLALKGSELLKALSELDAEGWNMEGRVGRSSWLRASILCCKFREEILELSLGSNPIGLHDRAYDLIRRQKEAYDTLPPKLRDRKDQWVLGRSAAENFFHLTKHLDPIYNEFLLHRTLVKRLREDPAELIRVSRSQLSSLLVLCGNRHRQGYYAADLPWLIALYGLPPAGVLALELLQQHSDRSKAPDLNFPRSDIVQKLSILISSIDCIVRPTNGNYGICGQAKKMLQAVLDTVLAPALAAEPAVMVSGPQPEGSISGLAEQDLMADATLESTQTWFDSTNFDIDFWNNLEDHPLLSWPDVT